MAGVVNMVVSKSHRALTLSLDSSGEEADYPPDTGISTGTHEQAIEAQKHREGGSGQGRQAPALFKRLAGLAHLAQSCRRPQA